MRLLAFSILLAHLFPFFCSAQVIKPGPNQGIVTIGLSGTPSPNPDSAVRLWRYFIKGNLVIRKDSATNQTGKGRPAGPFRIWQVPDSTVADYARNLQPAWLLDLDKKESYTFYRKGGLLYASLDSLPNNSYELCYRLYLQAASFSKVDYSDSGVAEIISGKKCYRGIALTKRGDSIFFKYTREPVGVSTPLSNLIPDFPYNIMYVKIPVDNSGNPPHYIILKVTGIEEKLLPEEWFTIPKYITIKRNVPREEIIKGRD